MDPGRKQPVVAVTTRPGGEPWLDPARLEEALGGLAEVVLIETGDATWALADALPPRLDAYGGAVRVWWPGLQPGSDPYDHPLLFVHAPDEAERVLRRLVDAVHARASGGWERVLEELRVGDVVEGRVKDVVEFGAFVELQPGVAGLVHKSEIDWSYVRDVREFVQPGEIVAVWVKAIDKEHRRIELSIKQAQGVHARELPGRAPLRGGALAPSPAAAPARDEVAELRARLQDLEEELQENNKDRASLRARNTELTKKLKSADDSRLALEKRQHDPLASERAFLLGVRLAYARLLDEDDRQRHPLLRMRVGSGFLDSLRSLEGVDVEKVLDVCAQVACGLAQDMPSREVHQLRTASRGAPGKVRASDGARAWRCGLQVRSPSARRLHWWRIDGPEGATIEFASVGVHDDFRIPE